MGVARRPMERALIGMMGPRWALFGMMGPRWALFGMVVMRPGERTVHWLLGEAVSYYGVHEGGGGRQVRWEQGHMDTTANQNEIEGGGGRKRGEKGTWNKRGWTEI